MDRTPKKNQTHPLPASRAIALVAFNEFRFPYFLFPFPIFATTTCEFPISVFVFILTYHAELTTYHSVFTPTPPPHLNSMALGSPGTHTSCSSPHTQSAPAASIPPSRAISAFCNGVFFPVATSIRYTVPSAGVDSVINNPPSVHFIAPISVPSFSGSQGWGHVYRLMDSAHPSL
jgi:hypothetical protein